MDRIRFHTFKKNCALAQLMWQNRWPIFLVKPNPNTKSHHSSLSLTSPHLLSLTSPSSFSSPPHLLSPHIPIFPFLTSLPHYLSSPFHRHTHHHQQPPPTHDSRRLLRCDFGFVCRRQNLWPSSNWLRFQRKNMQIWISIARIRQNSITRSRQNSDEDFEEKCRWGFKLFFSSFSFWIFLILDDKRFLVCR